MELTIKELIQTNIDQIKNNMLWNNYELNEVVIPVVEQVKNDAINVLVRSYGMFHVEQNRLDEIVGDVFTYFPVLLQELSITRLIDSYGVVKDDTDSVETIRTETLNTVVDENATITQGTIQTDNNTSVSKSKTTGTVEIDNIGSGTQTSNTTIQNDSDVEQTGSKSVNLSHMLPEQDINGVTNDFATDAQGTPILNTSTVQNANENFATNNPIVSRETSEQTISNTSNSTDNSLTTNDVTVDNDGNAVRTVTNSGSDTSESSSSTTGTNTVSETVNSITTNKQYAYEIKAFLETADSLIAFQRWENRFSWLCGII